jgi:hypothetical protein
MYAVAGRACSAAGGARDLVTLLSEGMTFGCAVAGRLSTYPGGRGGKECVASLRAEQRLAPGGGAP